MVTKFNCLVKFSKGHFHAPPQKISAYAPADTSRQISSKLTIVAQCFAVGDRKHCAITVLNRLVSNDVIFYKSSKRVCVCAAAECVSSPCTQAELDLKGTALKIY